MQFTRFVGIFWATTRPKDGEAMELKSITGDQNHVVCFQDSGFEAGISCFQSTGNRYCVWQEGEEIRSSTGDSWDDLLLRLLNKNTAAARWLLMKGVAFINPEETMAKAVASKIILNARITSSEGAVLVVVWAETEETKAIMAANDWKKHEGSADTFSYQPTT